MLLIAFFSGVALKATMGAQGSSMWWMVYL